MELILLKNFWARGYFVSTVGRDEETVKRYIKKQEDADPGNDCKSGHG